MAFNLNFESVNTLDSAGSDYEPNLKKGFVSKKSDELTALTLKDSKLEAKEITFEQTDDYKGAQEIAGAIFETKLDLSHPINFGMPRNTLPIFRNT